MVDKANKDSQKTQGNAKEKAGLDAQSMTLDDQIRDSMAKGTVGKRKKARKEAIMKYSAYGAGAILFLMLVSWLFTTQKGGINFGVCKTFLETIVQYPPEMRLTNSRTIGRTIRISYVEHDSYGHKHLKSLDCKFERNPQKGLYIKDAAINRRAIDPEIVQRFNKTIPVVIASEPDLTLPYKLGGTLKALKVSR